MSGNDIKNALVRYRRAHKDVDTQYRFTLSVVLPESAVDDHEIEYALDYFRGFGSVAVTKVERVDPTDRDHLGEVFKEEES